MKGGGGGVSSFTILSSFVKLRIQEMKGRVPVAPLF